MAKFTRTDFSDDIFLLRLISQEDKQAFRYLFDLYFTSLCRFVRVYVKENLIAEEIVLDVFVNVWENRKSLDIKVSWKAYLFQSAKNRALNYLRDNERYVNVSDWSLYDKAEVDHTVEMNELTYLIIEAIDSLPERTQEVFRKSRMEHLTNKEIAGELDVTVKTVEAHITNAIKLIKKSLGKGYHYLW